MAKRWRWALAGLVALVVLIPVGTYVYIHFVEGDAPDRLALAPTTASTVRSGATGTGTQGGVSGTWRPTSASQVGYRVKEVLFGQGHDAVGRTNKVTGTLTVDGTTVTATTLSVDMTSVTSDERRRDNQFQGRIMDTATYPTATFRLTRPIQLDQLPAGATPAPARAVGDLTLRGKTRPVTVDLTARRNGAQLEVNGTIPIAFGEWGIPNPSFGPVTTEDHGVLELLVVFQRAT